jgi:hypothetical protein
VVSGRSAALLFGLEHSRLFVFIGGPNKSGHDDFWRG